MNDPTTLAICAAIVSLYFFMSFYLAWSRKSFWARMILPMITLLCIILSSALPYQNIPSGEEKCDLLRKIVPVSGTETKQRSASGQVANTQVKSMAQKSGTATDNTSEKALYVLETSAIALSSWTLTRNDILYLVSENQWFLMIQVLLVFILGFISPSLKTLLAVNRLIAMAAVYGVAGDYDGARNAIRKAARCTVDGLCLFDSLRMILLHTAVAYETFYKIRILATKPEILTSRKNENKPHKPSEFELIDADVFDLITQQAGKLKSRLPDSPICLHPARRVVIGLFLCADRFRAEWALPSSTKSRLDSEDPQIDMALSLDTSKSTRKRNPPKKNEEESGNARVRLPEEFSERFVDSTDLIAKFVNDIKRFNWVKRAAV